MGPDNILSWNENLPPKQPLWYKTTDNLLDLKSLAKMKNKFTISRD